MSSPTEAIAFGRIKVDEDTGHLLINSDVVRMQLEEFYVNATTFYKELQNKQEFTFDYNIKLRLLALFKQVRYGQFNEDACDYGWFNFTGSDTRKEWLKIAHLSKQQAMLEFVNLFDVACPRQESPDNLRSSPALSVAESAFAEPQFESEAHHKQFEEQKRKIQVALNKQTYHQFLAYAQQTVPGEPEKQQQLIVALQERHYQQYMAQVYKQQCQAQNANIENGDGSVSDGANSGLLLANQLGKFTIADETVPTHLPTEKPTIDEDTDGSVSEPHDDLPSNPNIEPATIWSRKDVVEFKEGVKKEGSEGIFKISHGETVTIRVPTHQDGNCLFWEFATDYYDLGFGVYFEWSASESNDISIVVSESSDEEGEEEAFEGGRPSGGPEDVENRVSECGRTASKVPTDCIFPIYRRDSHTEVIAGSHKYPGTGVYLLKFDNSYSLWRSKTLYYRIYYTK
uniref:Golgi resident protein GCP60 n=1 Tax=Rhabditophanes sp. KR3021 TaxID=114890 RepID=A0AC35U1L6_9BILA